MSQETPLARAVEAVVEQAHAESITAHGRVEPAFVERYLAVTVIELARGTSSGFLRLRADSARDGGGDAALPHTTEL